MIGSANERGRNTRIANNSESLKDCLEKKLNTRRKTNSAGKVEL